jgi:formylglycine-generating enzyme required for sulfatase activity
LEFKVSALPEVPRAEAPAAEGFGDVPRAQLPGEIGKAEGIDFGTVDVDALEKYDAAVKFEKSPASGEEKAAKWRELGRDTQAYAEISKKRAAAWDDYAEQAAFEAVLEKDKGPAEPTEKAGNWLDLAKKYPRYAQTAEQRAQEWRRYAQELEAAEEAKAKRAEIRDKDWGKLSRLLALSVVGEADKRKFAAVFVGAYGKASDENPYAAELAAYLPPGTVKIVAGASKASVQNGKMGIQWVRIPGGTFTMGSNDYYDAQPHRVTVKSFQLAKTLVTNKQYRACVDAGACTAPGSYSGGDDHPVVNVDWNQAKAFSEWVGGRLPSEAEWEYAARSAGKDRKYPWGDEDATCKRAVISGCGYNSTAPVCSKPAGNTMQGLCDMAGNAWEWVQDWYHNSYDGAPSDGSAWENPTGSYRVLRGGSWCYDAGFARSAYRDSNDPGSRSNNFGFRPAR